MMNYDLPEVPNTKDIKAVIGNRVPFLSKNLSTLLEIRRRNANKGFLALLGKDSEFKGVHVTDNLFKVTGVASNGAVTVEKSTGHLFLNGEAVYVDTSSLIIDEFNNNEDTFSIFLGYETEFYHNVEDDSPVVGLEETVARQRLVWTLHQEIGVGVQDTIKWDSTKEEQHGKILLCQVTNFTTSPTYTDKRYFVGIPYFNTRRFTNLYNILDSLKYLDEDGITERTFVTEEIPQTPKGITVYSVNILKDSLKEYNLLRDKVLLRDAANISVNNSSVSIVALESLNTLATLIGSGGFTDAKAKIEGVNVSTDPLQIEDAERNFVDLGVESGDTIYNLSTRSVGSISSVNQHKLGVKGITFNTNDKYAIPQGDISESIEANYFIGKLSKEEYEALYTASSLGVFNETIGNNTSGLIGARISDREQSNIRISQLEADIREEFSISSADVKYFLRLSWEEPTLQSDNLTPLTQDIVSAAIRVVKVNKLSEGEKNTVLGKDTIDSAIVEARRLVDDTYEVATKLKKYSPDLQKSFYEEIPVGKIFTFPVKWNDSYLIYIAPITEYGIIGAWKPIYVDVSAETIQGRSILDDFKEDMQLERKKDEVLFSAYARSIDEQQFQLNRVLATVPTTLQVKTMIDNSAK
jgi:hypothetical protein